MPQNNLLDRVADSMGNAPQRPVPRPQNRVQMEPPPLPTRSAPQRQQVDPRAIAAMRQRQAMIAQQQAQRQAMAQQQALAQRQAMMAQRQQPVEQQDPSRVYQAPGQGMNQDLGQMDSSRVEAIIDRLNSFSDDQLLDIVQNYAGRPLGDFANDIIVGRSPYGQM